MATKTPTPSRNDKSGRRRKVTKFALAGVAVLGVGAALTSAAWTDNVWFAADASSGAVDLRGSADGGGTWAEGNTSGGAVVIGVTEFADMAPLEERSVTLLVRNFGQGIFTLNEEPVASTSTNNIFTDADIDVSGLSFTTDLHADGLLDPGDVASYTMTVTAPDWSDAQQNQDAVLYVQVGAST